MKRNSGRKALHVGAALLMAAMVITPRAKAGLVICQDVSVSGTVSASSPLNDVYMASFHTFGIGTEAFISQLNLDALGAFSTTACVPLGETLLGYSILAGYGEGGGVVTSFLDTGPIIGTPWETVYPAYNEPDVATAISTLDFSTLGAFSLDHYFAGHGSAFGGSGSLIGFSDGQPLGSVSADVVPEPSQGLLCLAGLVGVLVTRRRRRD